MDYTHILTPSLGIGGILLTAVIMILRGDIVPRKQVDAELKQKDLAIAFYSEALARSERQHREKDALIAGLMETTRTTRNVLNALPEAAGLNQGGSHAPTPED